MPVQSIEKVQRAARLGRRLERFTNPKQVLTGMSQIVVIQGFAAHSHQRSSWFDVQSYMRCCVTATSGSERRLFAVAFRPVPSAGFPSLC